MEVRQGVELYNKTGRELVQFISCWLDGGRSDLYSITREKSAISLYTNLFSLHPLRLLFFICLSSVEFPRCITGVELSVSAQCICAFGTTPEWSGKDSKLCVCLCVWEVGKPIWWTKNAQQGEWNMSVCITSGLFKNAAISIWTVCVCQGVPAAVEQSEVILQKRRSLLIHRLLCGVKWSWSETLH